MEDDNKFKETAKRVGTIIKSGAIGTANLTWSVTKWLASTTVTASKAVAGQTAKLTKSAANETVKLTKSVTSKLSGAQEFSTAMESAMRTSKEVTRITDPLIDARDSLSKYSRKVTVPIVLVAACCAYRLDPLKAMRIVQGTAVFGTGMWFVTPPNK